jgi:hypothetical protein
MNRQSATTINQYLNIEREIAVKTLILAAASGIVAALVDRVIQLPTQTLLFAFSEFIVALNGPTYAQFKGKDTLAGAIMSAVNGLVTLVLWWISAKIVGTAKIANPADYYNLIELFLEGALVGLIGFGWFALVHRLQLMKIGR